MPFSVPLLSCIFAAGLCGLLLFRTRRRSVNLPPGPRSLPIIGNILDIPTKGGPSVFRGMNAKYGDIVYLDALGQPMIVLGSHQAAVDLLEKRSTKYSDRVPFVMADICSLNWVLTLLPYGPWWRRHRRAMHEFFNANALEKYNASQRMDISCFIVRLIDDPEGFVHHIRRLFGSSVMRIAYGIEVDAGHDKYLKIVEEGLAVFSAALVPGKYLVETFPILRHVPAWFPWATFKKDGAVWKEAVLAVLHEPWKAAIEMINEGNAPPSMVKTLMERVSKVPSAEAAEEEEIARDTAAVAYGGGADTTLSTVQWFLFAMAAHPEVQKAAQAEIDAVVGPNRLPDYADQNSLPYVSAVILECLRWRSVVPLSIPHKSTEDDEYRGYFIPKGSIVIANIWAFSRDPVMFPDPEAFKPERHLKDGKLNPDVCSPANIAFGYGRRICPGKLYAERSLFMIVSSVIHALDIRAPLGADGNPIRMEGIMTEGVLSYPKPFKCVIKSRSATAEALVRENCGSRD